MSVCKHPNNIKNYERECNRDKKYNICYGEGENFENLEELEKYVDELEKNVFKSSELREVYTNGCWENKTGKPFLKDFNKTDEKDPLKCLNDNNKWITGDGYIISKKENTSNIKEDTSKKINVMCSPGYQGEPGIDNSCSKYSKYKEGDEGKYEQFNLLGCNPCKEKYVGNINEKNDRTCYPQCGLIGKELFDPTNSNKNLRFVDTKKDFTLGEKRAGYCCDDIKNALSIERIKGSEKALNYMDCVVSRCEDGYIISKDGKHCCRKILNSKDNVEYDCTGDSEDTKPHKIDEQFCKDGYHPSYDEDGLLYCTKCIRDEGIHEYADIICDNDGNVKIKENSNYKCKYDGLTYYNNKDKVCEKCPENMIVNKNYDKDDNTSNICECKPGYLDENDGTCMQCKGDYIEYNEKYPDDANSKPCKCVITAEGNKGTGSQLLNENVLIGDCKDRELYDGETCNLECESGYVLTGEQPTCRQNNIQLDNVRCIRDTKEGFDNNNKNDCMFNTKRLFLLFLLIILILNVM